MRASRPDTCPAGADLRSDRAETRATGADASASRGGTRLDRPDMRSDGPHASPSAATTSANSSYTPVNAADTSPDGAYTRASRRDTRPARGGMRGETRGNPFDGRHEPAPAWETRSNRPAMRSSRANRPPVAWHTLVIRVRKRPVSRGDRPVATHQRCSSVSGTVCSRCRGACPGREREVSLARRPGRRAIRARSRVGRPIARSPGGRAATEIPRGCDGCREGASRSRRPGSTAACGG